MLLKPSPSPTEVKLPPQDNNGDRLIFIKSTDPLTGQDVFEVGPNGELDQISGKIPPPNENPEYKIFLFYQTILPPGISEISSEFQELVNSFTQQKLYDLVLVKNIKSSEVRAMAEKNKPKQVNLNKGDWKETPVIGLYGGFVLSKKIYQPYPLMPFRTGLVRNLAGTQIWSTSYNTKELTDFILEKYAFSKRKSSLKFWGGILDVKLALQGALFQKLAGFEEFSEIQNFENGRRLRGEALVKYIYAFQPYCKIDNMIYEYEFYHFVDPPNLPNNYLDNIKITTGNIGLPGSPVIIHLDLNERYELLKFSKRQP